MHEQLVRFRRKWAAKIKDYKPPQHSCPREALDSILGCQACDGLPWRPAACWMQRGCSCGGVAVCYKLVPLEKRTGSRAKKITFSVYEYRDMPAEQTRGKPKRIKMLVTRKVPIGTFMKDWYIPSLQDYHYHATVNDITTFMSNQHVLPVGDARDRRDFAMRLGASFEGMTQDSNWIKESVGIESSITESYAPDIIAAPAPAVVPPRRRWQQEHRATGTEPVHEPQLPPLKEEHNFHFTAYANQDCQTVYQPQHGRHDLTPAGSECTATG